MRLLFLEETPRFGGGSERMSLALCQYAAAHGHDTVLAYAQPGDMVEAYRRAGAACHQIAARPLAVRRPVQVARSIAELVRLTRQTRPDVLFTSQVNYVSLLATAAWLTRSASAVHLGLTYDYDSPLFRAGMRRISLGVAPSAHTADDWRERGWPATSLRVIPNGVDTARFSPADGRAAARARCGFSPTGDLIAFVGRLVPAKGIFTLLRAFAACHRARPGARLVFVGAGNDAEVSVLRALAKEEQLPDSAWQVRSATPVPEDIYRAADLVVVPSQWEEPFGLVPLEAASCGTLTIVSDKGVLPTFVSTLQRAAVFAAGDVAALADRLTFWLCDRSRRESAAARLAEDVRARFGLAACGDAYLAAFETVRRK